MAFADREAEEPAQGVDGPRDRSRGEAFVAELPDEARDVRLDEIEQRAMVRGRERRQARDVAAVGLEGVRRQSPLDAEMVEVLPVDV
jgi:hypothetical protein